MIPKTIHYVWFGSSKYPRKIKLCMDSWFSILKDYNFKTWNEENIDLDCDFAKQAFIEKKWAFLSDYMRLKVLYEYGGVYLDTDMLVVKDFNNLLENEVFLGNETDNIINGAIIGAKKKSEFVMLLIEYYRGITLKEVEPIPVIITEMLKSYKGSDKIKIYPIDYFYPFPYESSYEYKAEPRSFITKNTYAIHLWHKSWKTDMYKYIRVKNYIGALSALIGLLKENPKSKKLWSRVPGTIKLSFVQLWKTVYK